MLAAAVAQVVAVDAGDNDVVQFQCRDGLGEILGFVHVERVGSTMADITKRATARAFVAHDHESGGAFAKAFADIGTAGFFADGHQFVGPQNIFDFVKPCTGGTRFDADPIGLFQNLARLHFDRNTRQFGRRFLFGGRVVVVNGLRFAHNFGRMARHVWEPCGQGLK